MAVQSTVRFILFTAACFLAFALTACDSPPAQKQQGQSKQQSQSDVVSKKIIKEKTETTETTKTTETTEKKKARKTQDEKDARKTAEKETGSNKKPATLNEKDKEKETKPAAGPEKTEKPEVEKGIQVSQSQPAYSAAGKINPFLPLIQGGAAAKEEEKKPERELTPLEKLDLSQLQLVAIVGSAGEGEDFAMVQEASGKGYIVQKGTYIGTNSGIVTRIGKEKIIIEESYTDFKGEDKNRKREMKLQKQDNKE